MTLPITNKNLVLHSSTPPNADRETAGWDPFEVWRTRVLLPRLAEARSEKAATTKAATAPSPTPQQSVKLVRP